MEQSGNRLLNNDHLDYFLDDIPETNPEGFFNELSNQVGLILILNL